MLGLGYVASVVDDDFIHDLLQFLFLLVSKLSEPILFALLPHCLNHFVGARGTEDGTTEHFETVFLRLNSVFCLKVLVLDGSLPLQLLKSQLSKSLQNALNTVLVKFANFAKLLCSSGIEYLLNAVVIFCMQLLFQVGFPLLKLLKLPLLSSVEFRTGSDFSNAVFLVQSEFSV